MGPWKQDLAQITEDARGGRDGVQWSHRGPSSSGIETICGAVFGEVFFFPSKVRYPTPTSSSPSPHKEHPMLQNLKVK